MALEHSRQCLFLFMEKYLIHDNAVLLRKNFAFLNAKIPIMCYDKFVDK